MIKTAALYARFSSDVQNERSIDRQFSDLEGIAQKFGLSVRHRFADEAKSATSLHHRPGLTRDLLGAAYRGEFNILLVELTDRLSRDKADLFWLAKRLQKRGIEIWDKDGAVSEFKLLFDSHTNEDFIKKLRIRVKSGHNLATRSGRIMGGAAYGYDNVKGEPGVKVINKEEAETVIFIFTSYANGMSPREIVKVLAARGIPSPTGAPIWNYQGIVGGNNTNTGRGLIHNELYIGKLVRNRTKRFFDDDTGQKLHRLGNADELITIDVPHMRIVSDELWNAAHAVRRERANRMNPTGTKQRTVLTRKQHLLSGLIRCASCGGTMSMKSSARGGQVACSAANYRQECDHTKCYDLGTITKAVIDRLEKELTDPELLKERHQARVQELARLERESSNERHEVQKQLDRLNLQIARLTTVLENTDIPIEEIVKSMQAKDVERRALTERLRAMGAESNVTTLHPATVSAFGKSITRLAALLRQNPDDAECRLALGNVIDSVMIHPTPKKRPYDISLYGRMSAITAADIFHPTRSKEEIVAGEGLLNNFGTGNTNVLRLPRSNNRNDVVLLSRFTFKTAA